MIDDQHDQRLVYMRPPEANENAKPKFKQQCLSEMIDNWLRGKQTDPTHKMERPKHERLHIESQKKC